MDLELRIWRFHFHIGCTYAAPAPYEPPEPDYSPSVGFVMTGPEYVPDDVEAHLPERW